MCEEFCWAYRCRQECVEHVAVGFGSRLARELVVCERMKNSRGELDYKPEGLSWTVFVYFLLSLVGHVQMGFS